MKWIMVLVFVSALLVSNVVGEIDTQQIITEVETELETELPDLPYNVYVGCSPHMIPTSDGFSVDGYTIDLIIINTVLANDSPQANAIADMLVEVGVRVASRYPDDKFWITSIIQAKEHGGARIVSEAFVGI